jgi:branched-chain amino acid transport system ATP-binding protein
MTALVELDAVVTGYTHPVLRDVSFTVDEGELVVLTGLNGAGKTTTVSLLAGLLRPWSGSVRLDGEDVGGRTPPELVQRGVALVPEGRRVFPSLSVADHLRLGAWTRRRDRAGTEVARAEVERLFPRLAERPGQAAGTLSGGEQQMLAIGRAMMSRPRLLVVDEASLGLSPTVAGMVFDALAALAGSGTAVLAVEQQTALAERADRVVLLDKGTVALAGAGAEVDGDELRVRLLWPDSGRAA